MYPGHFIIRKLELQRRKLKFTKQFIILPKVTEFVSDGAWIPPHTLPPFPRSGYGCKGHYFSKYGVGLPWVSDYRISVTGPKNLQV